MTNQGKHNVDLAFTQSFSELRVEYDEKLEAIWLYMKGAPRPCFTMNLLNELEALYSQLSKMEGVHYVVACSDIPNVYNLGGDLSLFLEHIEQGEREKLREYAYACIGCIYGSAIQITHGITTIALVQGSALGGGFEAAASCNVIIAEENARLGFPEILFNLFPGMGAYSILSRKTSVNQTEKMVLSGEQYNSVALHEMGVVDVLAKDGEGKQVVKEYIAEHRKQRRTRVAIYQARMRLNPMTMEELRDIADIWVDAAMDTDEESLVVMRRLVRAQDRKLATKKLLEKVSNG